MNGKIGPIKAIYTGGYLVRNVDQVGDYTNYARGVYADYYQCYGPGADASKSLTPTCYSPSTTWQEIERNEHLSQELRFSTPDDWRLRGIAGAFYEDNKLFDQTDWAYKTMPNCTSNTAPDTPGNTGCLSPVGTAPGATVQDPGAQNNGVAFFEDTQREVKQTAFFASLDFDIIPKVLTVTAGTRHYLFENSMIGSVTGSFGCFEAGDPVGGCIASANNLDARHLRDTESGFKSRGNITWHVTPDTMLYYTYSQGFRPGGFNRTDSCHIPGGAIGAVAVDQFCLPQSYKSDQLTNNEIGWKTEWLEHRVQFNGAFYQENWDDVQVGFYDPGQTGNLTFGTNGQNFRIRGVETSIIARVTHGLTLQGSASWNQSVQTNSPALTDNNPLSPTYGQPITQGCATTKGVVTGCTPLTNLYGPVGGPSANAPPIQYNARARYDWTVNEFNYFVQVGMTHTGHSYTQAGANPSIATGGAVNTTVLRFQNPEYSTVDASLGVAKDAWYAQVYGQNLSNSDASLFTNTGQFVVAQTPLRPRVLGLKFGYKF